MVIEKLISNIKTPTGIKLVGVYFGINWNVNSKKNIIDNNAN